MEESPWSAVGMYGGAVAAGAVLFAFKKFRGWAGRVFRKAQGKHSAYPETKCFVMDRNIHDLLIELRTRTNAARCCLYQFHNGQIFSSSNPVWRVSCTHESCASGISHELSNNQSLLSSSLIDLLGTLFGLKPLPSGVTALPSEAISTHYVFDVAGLRESFWRSILLNSGTNYVCIHPIVVGGQVIAFVSVCYREDVVLSEDNLENIKDFGARITFEISRGGN